MHGSDPHAVASPCAFVIRIYQRRCTERVVLGTISVPLQATSSRAAAVCRLPGGADVAAGTQASCQRSGSLTSLSASYRTQVKGCRGSTGLQVKVPAMKEQLRNLLNFREACAWQQPAEDQALPQPAARSCETSTCFTSNCSGANSSISGTGFKESNTTFGSNLFRTKFV